MKIRKLPLHTWGNIDILHCDGCGIFLPEKKLRHPGTRHEGCFRDGILQSIIGKNYE